MPTEYITKSGDTWDMIAKEVYGSESYTSFLMEHNQELIETFIFPGGVHLKIVALPEVEVEGFPEWRS